MTIEIDICTDNAAFEDNPTEVGDILRKLAKAIDRYGFVDEDFSITLRDYNGNNVGKARANK